MLLCSDAVYVLQNIGAIAALQAADELMDTADKPQSVLRIVIDNMIYPVTLEVICKVCFLVYLDVSNVLIPDSSRKSSPFKTYFLSSLRPVGYDGEYKVDKSWYIMRGMISRIKPI